MNDESVPLITLPNWVKAASVCGFSIEPVFRELGIDVDLLHVESATLHRSDFERLMGACVARSPRRHFPLVLGGTFAFEYLPEVETFLSTSPSLRESARVFEWLPALINPHLTVRVQENESQASITMDWAHAQAPQVFQWFVEATFVSVLKFGRALLRGHGDFRRATFQHPRPAYVSEFTDVFRVPVAFDQPHNALELDRRLLDLRLDGAFESLHQQAELRVAQRLSKRPPPAGLASRLESVLERNPALLGLGIEQAAAELGLHPRTLQRRLRDENLSYVAIQSQVRRHLAETWLADPKSDIEAIAGRLGFSDRRSFTRAFAAWSGMTPSEFRATRGIGNL